MARCAPLAGLLIGAMLVAAGVTGSTLVESLPSPQDGPGRPELKRKESKRLGRAFGLLESGDSGAARRQAEQAAESPARELLLAQVDLVEGDAQSQQRLAALVEREPGYAAAWLTLSLAAEQAGDEARALEAARQVERLWGGRRASERVAQLERRWVGDRVDRAEQLMQSGEAGAALELLNRALPLAPDDRRARLAKAGALVELGELDQAKAQLDGLAGEPEATLVAAMIAERRQDWQAAMELYDSLPAGFKGRDDALRRVQQRWRLEHLPPYVQEALRSKSLTRAELAVLLVDLAPELAAIEGGRVPLLTDIVDLDCRDEILTAVRLELLDVDELEHGFDPNRTASLPEVRAAVDGVCHLLGVQAPVWCADGMPSPSCVTAGLPVSGEWLAGVLLDLVQEEKP